MKKQLIYLLVLILFSAVMSCTKTETGTDLPENIRISMHEAVDSAKRIFTLRFQTDTVYPCSNYTIETTWTLANDKITINFIKVHTYTLCLTSPGPALAAIDFTNLANKTYTMELNFGATTVTGQLVVTANSFVATLPMQSKVQFVIPELKRLKDNTIFGRVGYHTASTAQLAQTFIDSLQVLGATPVTNYQPGNYTQFQLDANGQIVPGLDGYKFRHTYIFNYSNSSEQLKALVKRYAGKYSSSLSISLNTAKGEAFYSWVP